jgi:sulfite reductase (NADPH) flavoprotein alpha-component
VPAFQPAPATTYCKRGHRWWFFRDQAKKVYVQDRLPAAGSLVDWLAQDAAIYVCGSAQTMAPAVDRVLHELLGAGMVACLQAQNRYQRDIY